ncbi:hypothetical protein Zmor_027632 [Zophobas morio]|uniref:Uncharacterized protein n=1 Tax=Zophobas morio TaxID=2755281 RepID=A0AA38HP73_9CUCU|nr:hypothetical protein Zmor_027632 [Zophobas morio]
MEGGWYMFQARPPEIHDQNDTPATGSHLRPESRRLEDDRFGPTANWLTVFLRGKNSPHQMVARMVFPDVGLCLPGRGTVLSRKWFDGRRWAIGVAGAMVWRTYPELGAPVHAVGCGRH